MPQYQPRLYEPSDEPRAFDDREEEFQDDEGSRLPLLIVIALVVLASFAGVVWVAYTQGVQRGREDAPRVLAAERKSASKEQTNPYAKLDIYKAPKPSSDAAAQSSASPIQPERTPPPATQSAAGSTAQAENEAPAVTPKTAPVVPKPAAPPKAAPAQNMASVANRPHPALGAPKTITPPAARLQSGQVQPPTSNTEQASANPAEPPPAPPASAGGQGGYVLQIGSYTSEAEATASWQTYKQVHAGVAGYAPDIKSADLGKRGTWYRLRIGPFGSLAEASAACARLKAQGASCLPAKQ
ncbi:MAG TPA: SPOR domain-containing protein [Rhizomicrobium sp.]|nr:SPOR domain-containing protein [Rhizomicrobium sp.]